MTQTATRESYKSPLHEMTQTTRTCLWNDSASIEELTYSIEHGAVGATCNPVIVLGVLKKEMPQWKPRIQALIEEWPKATEEQITALRTGIPTNDAKIDVLTGLVREAAANSGNVTDATWKAAQQAGWSDEQLTDAFAYLGATVFTGYFLNYAQTEMDAL